MLQGVDRLSGMADGFVEIEVNATLKPRLGPEVHGAADLACAGTWVGPTCEFIGCVQPQEVVDGDIRADRGEQAVAQRRGTAVFEFRADRAFDGKVLVQLG